MSDQPNMKMPKDSAHVVFWFKGLPQPTAFLTTREEADKALAGFRGGDEVVTVLSYPDGRGVRSESVFDFLMSFAVSSSVMHRETALP